MEVLLCLGEVGSAFGLGDRARIGDLSRCFLLGDLSRPLPLGDLSLPRPLGDLSRIRPGDLSRSLSLRPGDFDRERPCALGADNMTGFDVQGRCRGKVEQVIAR